MLQILYECTDFIRLCGYGIFVLYILYIYIIYNIHIILYNIYIYIMYIYYFIYISIFYVYIYMHILCYKEKSMTVKLYQLSVLWEFGGLPDKRQKTRLEQI